MNERIRYLKDFFPDLDERILVEALKANKFDVEIAANDLMDEDNVDIFRDKINS